MRDLPIPEGTLMFTWNSSPREHNVLAELKGQLIIQQFALSNGGNWWLKTLLPLPEKAASAIVDFYAGGDR